MRLAVVLPPAPVLVPEVARAGSAAAAELAAVRLACREALAPLAAPHGMPADHPPGRRAPGDRRSGAVGPTVPALVLVGPGEITRRHSPGSWGTLRGLGVAVEAPESHDGRDPSLPLSLALGRLLLDRAGVPGEPVLQEVAASASAAECLALGEGLAGEVGPDAGWVVLGDGSARRSPKGPAAFDPRAEPFDRSVEQALRAGDAAALARLDASLAAELLAAGRPAWQVLAGAARLQAPPDRCEVRHAAAPFGVGYLVATWARDGG
ncbi:MAG: hypothetical protein GXX79_01920 [Actinomycetales bacterium]|nr:hypothetical protein [Actinomycetales bacterium]